MGAKLRSVVDKSDSGLLFRAKSGDEGAAGLLFDRYSETSYGLALAIVGDEQVAQQVVAESFAELWHGTTRSEKSPVEGTLESAIALIVRRRALGRGRVGNSTSELQQVTRSVANGGAAPWSSRSVRELVAGVLDGLPRLQRRALELAFFRGLAVPEIAKEILEPEHTVVSYLRSAMDALKHANAMSSHTHTSLGGR